MPCWVDSSSVLSVPLRNSVGQTYFAHKALHTPTILASARHHIIHSVPGDGVYHLDAVHQCRQRVDDRRCRPAVQGLDKTFEGVQELNVVLGFVSRLGHVDVDLPHALLSVTSEMRGELLVNAPSRRQNNRDPPYKASWQKSGFLKFRGMFRSANATYVR